MKFLFKKIDLEAFKKGWNSNHYDQQEDSWEKPFEETPESEWKPFFVKASKLWREVSFEGDNIGYIFLSPKEDGSAHLGYGLYKEFRGRKLAVPMCELFLEENISTLDSSINHLLGTTLVSNIPSQKVLEKLGFRSYKEVVEDNIKYKQYRRDLK